MATLKDIAKEANVSMMTVSNVVNGNLHKVSKETAELIQEIVRRRNYVQNETARGLAKANSNIIAVMLRSIRGENALCSMHNATLLGAMTQRIQELGFYAMVNLVDGQADISRTLRSWNVQGAIFLECSTAKSRKSMRSATCRWFSSTATALHAAYRASG